MHRYVSLRLVSFPALIIADDGWVEYVGGPERLSAWTAYAVVKYRKRQIVLYDSQDKAWRVISILSPESSILLKLIASFWNPKVPVELIVERSDDPREAVRQILFTAIDADDDILTQFEDATKLKEATSKANSFKELVATLLSKGSISTVPGG